MQLLYNKKNPDGSVNGYWNTKVNDFGYFIPFTDPEFSTQVEEDIVEAVTILNLKGYHTRTSCCGHGLFKHLIGKNQSYNSGPQITLRVKEENLETLKSLFSTFFIRTIINRTIPCEPGSIYISVRCRALINRFFTNKFLCSKIEQLCKEVPENVY